MTREYTLSFHASGNDCAAIAGTYPREVAEIYEYMVEQGLPARLADAESILFDAPVKFTTVMAHYQSLSGRATLNWEDLRRDGDSA
jgi:hypothetical protein